MPSFCLPSDVPCSYCQRKELGLRFYDGQIVCYSCNTIQRIVDITSQRDHADQILRYIESIDSHGIGGMASQDVSQK